MTEYESSLKYTLEESLEAFGHLVLLVGLLETIIWTRCVDWAPAFAEQDAEDAAPAGETPRRAH
jgi:hypothetical protein